LANRLQGIELRLLEQPPSADNGRNLPCITDLQERIGLEQHEVGALSRLTVPYSLNSPKNSAGFRVAACNAAAGGSPARTRSSSSS